MINNSDNFILNTNKICRTMLIFLKQLINKSSKIAS